MAQYQGSERRKHSRVDANFVVSYRIKEVVDGYDLTQTKNVSQGGMLLTTNRLFNKGTFLAMTIRFPLIPQKIEVTGEVVGSREVVRDLIYETRIRFTDLDEEFFQKLGEFIKEHLK
ncbi:MAG: PilZ domain-containing protein [Candidatus Omnitrophica bacterium]|nr:PilZ domain-containing protein [Candidatus Omnitrophota bacterium]MBU2043916.1 PilZ domain-containing protein [Candidatus Omnitrophota bacterium]MBU2251405.1 PilZ domain-containing protein [Candidatus Omnitrophota bacterium]MBU2266393.1 PilZ domain-containing protein [Candidatus Omnitrophota bacterium]MBU2473342.1 PilZ domain-containing protein [Candidatus Omnitrophota bacterium]